MDRLETMLSGVLNELSELVYVADMETHDLLYINDAGRRTFHLGEDYSGAKCYRALQGLDAPCPFCTNGQLNAHTYLTWNYTNPLTRRHYVLKDRAIDWQGRPARMEIAFDLTENEQEKIDLQNALATQDVVLDCAKELYREADAQASIPRVLEMLGEYLGADRAYVFDIQGDKMSNTFEWCKPGVRPEKERLQQIDLALLDSWMPKFGRRECYVLEDVETLRTQDIRCFETLSAQNIRSLIAAPLERGGKLAGYLGVDNPPMEKIKNITALMQTLCYFVMLTIQRVEDEQELVRLSQIDRLTGLYNRNRYTLDLESVQAQGPAGVVYLDLNGLKDVNDRFGHERGDAVLCDCARMMREVFPEGRLYRIGGDEFIVLCRGVEEERFQALVEKLVHCAEGMECPPAVGARWTQDSGDLKRLISDADNEMYADKKKFYYRNASTRRYRHMTDSILELQDPELLREHIRAEDFFVYLQPKYSMVSRRVVGAEALVRYRHGGRLMLPGSFLPLMEAQGTAAELDFYVVETVLARLSAQQAAGRTPVPIAVNFSACAAAQPDFAPRLETLCKKYGVERRLLEIELNERNSGREDLDMAGVIARLKAEGFSVSLDNFGQAGRPNFSFLSTTDLNTLKLDGEIVRMGARSAKGKMLLRTIVAACRELEIEVVASGVETEDQVHMLQEIGLDHAQGYYFGRPLPADLFEETFL
jgi:diguanylate cyclase (GGDEF)-like protein